MNHIWETRAMKQGFTLVELLTVIGIVGILAAIMFPVFARAQERAMRSVSSSNLHQLGLAAVAYAGDSDDKLPPFRNDELKLLALDPNVTTTGIPTDSKEPALLVASLKPYSANSADIWHCSADSYWHTSEPFGLINHQYSSYIYVAIPAGWDGKTWPMVTSLSDMDPHDCLFGEATGTIGKSLRSYWEAPVELWVQPDGSIFTNHLPQ